MFKFVLASIVLFVLTSCVPLQQLPQTSLSTDVSAADTKFSQVVTRLHDEYERGHICASKLQEMQMVIRRTNMFIEQAYDAAAVGNIATVSKYLTRIETIRRSLELDLEIAKSGELLYGCASDRDGTIDFTPAFA